MMKLAHAYRREHLTCGSSRSSESGPSGSLWLIRVRVLRVTVVYQGQGHQEPGPGSSGYMWLTWVRFLRVAVANQSQGHQGIWLTRARIIKVSVAYQGQVHQGQGPCGSSGSWPSGSLWLIRARVYVATSGLGSSVYICDSSGFWS